LGGRWRFLADWLAGVSLQFLETVEFAVMLGLSEAG
jgi:hypothetical protein